MRNRILIFILISNFAFFACTKSTERVSHSSSTKQNPVFQIRNFSVKDTSNAQLQMYSYTGQGTVVVTDTELQKMNLFVLISYKDKSKGSDSSSWNDTMVFMKNGFGQVNIYRYDGLYKKERPEYEWKFLGWTELKQGKLEVAD